MAWRSANRAAERELICKSQLGANTVERIVGKRGPNIALRPDFLFDPILRGTGAVEVVRMKKELHRVSEKIFQSKNRYQFIAGSTNERVETPVGHIRIWSGVDTVHPVAQVEDGFDDSETASNSSANSVEAPRPTSANLSRHRTAHAPQTQAPRGRAGSSSLLTTSTLDRRTRA
ncbi:hypothetical protein C8R44DRAFT_746408 [Mycena epipterygia]|nr:hypothetical protein C8R44DRAFT_746408 [Mycena epipterygia]